MKIYVCVTGDLFHYGHISFFKKAKTFGDYLLVGIHSDDDAEEYKRRPIMTMQERTLVIEECRTVDEVITNAPAKTTEAFIKDNNIDLVVASKAYTDNIINDYFKDPKKMGILKLVEYENSISTTEVIKRCHKKVLQSNGKLGHF